MKNICLDVKSIGVKYSEVKGVFKRNQFWPLTDVSFSLYQGETLGILGRNGAGKTTLMRVLAGIIEPDLGSVSNPKNKHVVMLSLQSGFDRELSGLENIYLQGILMGMSRELIENSVESVVDFSGLGDFIHKPIKTYSTGMRARLGFSIAHQLHADVLMIDEALGVGDSSFRKKSNKAMKEKINSDQTVVLVSHSAALIKNLCDRAVWLDGGVSKMVGCASQVVDAYEQSMGR